MAHDVFISYSSKDREIADATCHWIENHGLTCWIAPRDILPSRTWGESIVTAIKEAKLMLVIFSSSANSSPQIKREVERAVHFDLPILPMRIENVPLEGDLAYFLAMPQWFNAVGLPIEPHLERLVEVLKKIITPAAAIKPAAVPRARAMPIPPPLPPPSTGTASLPSASPWSPDLLQKVESQLALTLGPIAKILVKNTARKHADWLVFIRDLADHIETPEGRKAFLDFCGRIKP
jgi:hypothetical protein